MSAREYGLLDTLRMELRRVLYVEYDKTINDILAYIIMKGPTTLYRVSRDTPYSISSIYKKAKRMVKDYLIKENESVGDRHTYEVTVKGLLVCLAYNCLDDEIVLNKLCRAWQMRSYCCQRLIELINVLPILFRLDPGNTKIIEDPRTLMVLLISNADQLRELINNNLFRNIINIATHYLVSRLFLEGQVVTKSSILIGNDQFIVNVSLDGDIYVYTCKLCNKQCFALRLPTINTQCLLLYEMRKKLGDILRG